MEIYMKKICLLACVIAVSGCGLNEKEQGLSDFNKYYAECGNFSKSPEAVKSFKRLPHITGATERKSVCTNVIKQAIVALETVKNEEEISQAIKSIKNEIYLMGNGFFKKIDAAS